jgi:DNA polymerase III subunit epsilon
MYAWQLDRPLAVFDIESTGTSTRGDRIVELCIARLTPDCERRDFLYRINPQMPIPPAVTAIHGISDADVADCPTFGELADDIAAAFQDCDLGGFHLLRFDIPMLEEEFLRVGKKFATEGRRIIDAQRIFHTKEPRDLTAALAFYCGELHIDAHGAAPDVEATIRVFQGQLQRYRDLPRDIAGLDAFCNPRDPTWADQTGKLKWQDNELVLNFGKNAGRSLRELVTTEPRFIDWLLRNDFPADTRAIVQRARQGEWPTPPPAQE